MIPAILAVLFGLILLIWSADRFVDGAAATAYRLGMSPLLVGMVIVGFGTSAPEIVVSALASAQGNPGLAIGNAIGSNISNIALILGITAMVSPMLVHSNIVRRELPILGAVSVFTALLLLDHDLSRIDGFILLLTFVVVMSWSIYTATRKGDDPLHGEFTEKLEEPTASLSRSLFWLIFGLVLLVVSSRLLVWGAVEIALALGVSDLIVGLTVVAVGTSLPELASSIAATRKGEHDIALGNIIGSNLFNTLCVIGLAGVIHPIGVQHEVLVRDLPVMGGLTVLLFFACFGIRGRGRISRSEGALLTIIYIGYTVWIVMSALKTASSITPAGI